MNRFRGSDQPIGRALDLLPPAARVLVEGIHWFCGADSVAAGLTPIYDTVDERSYRNTAHVCWPCHLTHLPLSERTTTIVLPEPESLETVVHELAHAIDWRLDFPRICKPVTSYAEIDQYEAFAEAFCAMLFPGYAQMPMDDDDRLWFEAFLNK